MVSAQSFWILTPTGDIYPEEISAPPMLAVARYDMTRERIVQNSTTPPGHQWGPVFGFIPARGPGRLTPRVMLQAAAAAARRAAAGGRPATRQTGKDPPGARRRAKGVDGSGAVEEAIEVISISSSSSISARRLISTGRRPLAHVPTRTIVYMPTRQRRIDRHPSKR